METTCPKVEKCPIFINNVLTVENAAVAYKNLYCQAGQTKYSQCKRFIISNKIGSCPQEVMPTALKQLKKY